jgi:glycosyltransferase involved in cell wall biosynthesis
MVKELRVCHVATMTNWGGVEKMLVDVLTHADQKRTRHFLLSTSSIPEVIAPIRQAGVPTFQPRRYFHYDPNAILQMARWMRSQGVHVVHSYNAFANSWANLTALLARVPVFISSERGTVWWIRPPMAWLDRWAHERADAVIANSRASATMLQLRYNVPTQKIHVVHNAVPPLPKADIEQIRAGLGIGKKLVVGSVGRLDTPKDFATLIDAAALVLKDRQDVCFILVGGGPLESELRERILESGIRDGFILTDWRVDARTLIQVFDIFVSTSVRETFGNALVEAALAGKPVIAPRVDGIPEVVHDKVTGILLTPTESMKPRRSASATPAASEVLIDGKLSSPKSLNPRRLAEAILHLLHQPDLRVKYGMAGKKRAESMFSLEKYVQQIENIYIGLIKQKRKTCANWEVRQ